MPEPLDLAKARRLVVARLVGRFGSRWMDEVLDAVQEATITALQTWPVKGEPVEPTAWLQQVATRRLVDQFRRQSRSAELGDTEAATQPEPTELDLYGMTCSPKLSERERLCLVLRVCAGLPTRDIARLLFETEEAVQRRISRAKNRLDQSDLDPLLTPEKLSSLLLVFFVLFTAGYEAGSGDRATHPELCLHAHWLARDLRGSLTQPHPPLEALLAMMCFHLGRWRSRNGPDGLPRLLHEQDRATDDPVWISQGFHHLALAQGGETLSRFHLEAGLAAAIARSAPSSEILDWHRLLRDEFPSPMARLSFALAVGHHEGWERGLAELERIVSDDVLRESPHAMGAMGFAMAKLGRNQEATTWYRRSISREMATPNRALFERILRDLE